VAHKQARDAGVADPAHGLRDQPPTLLLVVGALSVTKQFAARRCGRERSTLGPIPVGMLCELS